MMAFWELMVRQAKKAKEEAKQIERLRWLSGCWQMDQEGRRVVEQWTDHRGGLLLGTSRTIRDDRAVEYEFSAIMVDSTGKLVYRAHPARQQPATFDATSVTDTEITFTKPTHDFPTSISYRRRGGDSLIATIQGPSSGGEKRVVFPYRRAVCDTTS